MSNVHANCNKTRLGWLLLLFLVAFQFYSRYLPTPWAVLVADDWANLARSSFYSSHWHAAVAGLVDPNRPLSMLAVETVFRLFGRRALYWTVLSIAANTLLLLLLAGMVFALTGRRRVTLLAGVVFALLPNLTETFHWSTQVLNEVACALVPYAFSGWLWVLYARNGGLWRLLLSTGGYAVGLFSYEAGVLLPAAFIFLLAWRREPVRCALRVSPFAGVVLLYAAWRLTNAFGLNQTWHYPPHMQAGISLWTVSWNTRQIVHWWAGDNLFGAMLAGLQSFATLSTWTRRWLVLGNIAVLGLVGWWLIRLREGDAAPVDAPPFATWQVALFAVAWTAAAWAISLVSYTAPRLNVLPAMGISLLLALLLQRWPVRRWGPWLALPALLAMISNQGTAENFRQVGELNLRLYAALEESLEEWREKEVLFFDMASLRNRLTPGLLRPTGEDPSTWAYCGNALLHRGFVYGGMVRLVTGERRLPLRVLHDVEHGVRIEGDELLWHARYNPARPYRITLEDVYIVDVHGVTVERANR